MVKHTMEFLEEYLTESGSNFSGKFQKKKATAPDAVLFLKSGQRAVSLHPQIHLRLFTILKNSEIPHSAAIKTYIIILYVHNSAFDLLYLPYAMAVTRSHPLYDAKY